MSTWKSFEDIDAWQLAREFCDDVFEIMTETELKNDFRLKDQINGSSGSIMDNVAEGYGRGGNKEFINFLSISKGSAAEAISQLYRIYDRKYISEERFKELVAKVVEISNKIGGLMAYLKKSGFKGTKFK
jgi:four helix bundle protein